MLENSLYTLGVEFPETSLQRPIDVKMEKQQQHRICVNQKIRDVTSYIKNSLLVWETMSKKTIGWEEETSDCAHLCIMGKTFSKYQLAEA